MSPSLARSLPSAKRVIPNLPDDALALILKFLSHGLDLLDGGSSGLVLHRQTRLDLLRVGLVSRRLRPLALAALVRDIVLASPDEWCFWVGSGHAGRCGVLPGGFVHPCGFGTQGYPVRRVWVSLDGDHLPPHDLPPPAWDLLPLLRDAAGHLVIPNFAGYSTALPLSRPFSLHLLPVQSPPLSDPSNSDQSLPPRPPPIGPLPPTDWTATVGFHTTTAVPASLTAFLSESLLNRVWAFIGAFYCMSVYYQEDDLKLVGPYRSKIMEWRRRCLAESGDLHLGGPHADPRFAPVPYPYMNSYGDVAHRLVWELMGIVTDGHDDFADLYWVFRHPADYEEPEGWAWAEPVYPSHSDLELLALSANKIPILLQRMVLAVLQESVALVDCLFLSSPLLLSVHLPLGSPESGYAYLDAIGLAYKSLPLQLDHQDNDGRVCSVPR